MTDDELARSVEIINDLIAKHKTMRAFSRAISEDISDVWKWKKGQKRITPRAISSICKLYPEIKPHNLRPDIYPEGISFNFKKE